MRRQTAAWVGLVVLTVAAPAAYSYVTTMARPSSLPLGVRSVEWLRQNHGNWLVDQAERIYYGSKAPRAGGPTLTQLPVVGVAQRTAPRRRRPWPPPIRPLFARALPGEGLWHPTGPPVDGGPPVLVTTYRSERAYPRIVAYVAWFDHRRTSLAFYPGRYEPPHAPVRGPMEIPPAQRWRLLATFNGGFTYIDGHNGSAVDGHLNEPLQDGLATLLGYRDGRIALVTWHGGPSPGPDVVFARQSLPQIVRNGKLNPSLNDGPEWGYTLGNAIRVWRTGVGIDKRGNVIYAAANDQTVTTLARILQHAGAVQAMQFDINPEWPTLIAYRHYHGLIPTKIVPNVQQPATRYLVPDDRDFFAVYRRLPGAVDVPLK